MLPASLLKEDMYLGTCRGSREKSEARDSPAKTSPSSNECTLRRLKASRLRPTSSTHLTATFLPDSTVSRQTALSGRLSEAFSGQEKCSLLCAINSKALSTSDCLKIKILMRGISRQEDFLAKCPTVKFAARY